MQRPLTLSLLAAPAILLALPGCEMQRQSRSAADAPLIAPDPQSLALTALPDNFWLDVQVHAGREAAKSMLHSNDAESAPAQGRFLLLADGGLHYAGEKPWPQSSLPSQIRVLSRDEVADVWTLLAELGFADRANADSLSLPQPNPQPREIEYIISIHGRGQHWTFHRSAAIDAIHPQSPEAQLVERLAALAWLNDDLGRVRLAPVRYDFGPDPYARYR